jgi:hypothetical protein
LQLLDTLEPAEWFKQPTEGVCHLAWQVGHLATAEYSLALDRVRGPRREDEELIPADFRRRFGGGSTPEPDPLQNPDPSRIRAVLDAVHARTLADLKSIRDDELDQPTVRPHRVFNTKLGALTWCSQHELIHAGQIGLLRRLLGHPPLW